MVPVHSSIYMSLPKNAGSEERGSDGVSFALNNEGIELLLTDMYAHQNSSEIFGIKTF